MYTKEYKTLIREAHEKCSEWLDSSGVLKSRQYHQQRPLLSNIIYIAAVETF